MVSTGLRATPRRAAVCASLVIAGFAATADARLARAWTYAELTDKSDVVVIAAATKTTTSKTTEALPDSSFSGNRVDTELEVASVLKGKPGKKVVLHHVAIANDTAMVNGPNLVTFDPKTHDEFLMFLTLDKDGEYVPVNGQINPIVSIIPLHAPVTPPSNP